MPNICHVRAMPFWNMIANRIYSEQIGEKTDSYNEIVTKYKEHWTVKWERHTGKEESERPRKAYWKQES